MPVNGIGGLFFRARDPDALKQWYCEHLGVGCGDWGMWDQQAGTTVFSLTYLRNRRRGDG